MTAASDPIRVLHVDDEPDLADLTATFLERQEDRLTVETATRVADALEMLDKQRIDCVVSDYQMPEQNGIEFLKSVRESDPNLPFILFTGKGSEEIAADAISAGVTDYLQKATTTDQYAILANRIVNAVERARIEREAAQTRSQLEAISEHSTDAILVIDTDSRIQFANPAVSDLFGYSPDELEGERLTMLMPERNRKRHLDAIDQYLESGERSVNWSNVEFDGQHRDGTEFPLSVSFGEFGENGEQRFLGIVRDITERVAQDRRREQIISRVTDAIVEVDADWQFTLVNEQAQDLYGMDEADLLGRDFWDVFSGARGTRFEREYRAVMETREPTSFVEFLPQLDGWFDVSAYPNDDGGLSFYFVEVTEQRERQRELEETNSLLSTLFDALPQGVLVENEDREVLAANQQLFDMFDISGSPADVTGEDCTQIAREASELVAEPETFLARIDDLVEGREPVAGEELALADDRVFERTYRPLSLGGGQGHLWVYRDVTEHKERERYLEDEKVFIEQSIDALQDVFFVFRADGDLLRWNDRLPETTGYTTDEIADMGPVDFFPPDQQNRVADAVARILETGNATLEADVLTVAGERIPHELNGTRLLDSEGEVLGFAGTARDISDRKARERELLRTQDLLDQAERIADVGGWEIDPETMDVFWTGHLFDIFGVEGDTEPPLSEALDVYHEEDRSIVADAVEEALDTGDPFDVEVRFRQPDGEIRWLRIFGTPTVEDGKVVQLRGAVQDVTERKEYEQKLERQNARLEQFASVVSHDLRNPLNVAEGRLELARAECDSEHLDHVARAQGRMSDLIGDLLALAREGGTVGDLEPVDLADLVETCWETVPTEDATLRTDCDRTILADRSRLQQLFENLVRNAVEHGGPDVRMTVGLLADGFYVEDDGVGIPPDQHDSVFEAGYTTSEAGTGFGLSIVRQVATAHGWDVAVTESSEGGARFEFTGVAFADG